MKLKRPTAPVIWCLSAAALFGASTPACKALLGGVGPLALAGFLYLGAALATLPVAFRGGSRRLRRQKRSRMMLAGAVVFGGGLGPVLLLVGLSMAPAASVALWLNLETVATALLAWTLFREHLDRRTWFSIVLVVIAGVLLAAPSDFGSLVPAALVGLACLCWGLDNNLTALVDGFTPAQTTAIKGVFAGSANLILALVFEDLDIAFATIAGALVIGAVSYGLSILFYVHGAQHLGATRSQLLFSTSPFLGVIFAWTILGEPVQGAQIGAAALMVVALWFLLRGRHEHEHAHEAMVHTHSHRHDDGHHNHVHPGLPASVRHVHEHDHAPMVHTHPHAPDLHHRHDHHGKTPQLPDGRPEQ